MRPICARAHFAGIGFASTNSSRCNALRRASSCCAPLWSPASAAATISDIARGATFAVTEITPRAPAAMLSRALASSPLRTTKSFTQLPMSSRTRDASGTASLTPTIPATFDRRATVAGFISTAVRAGTLYNSSGFRTSAHLRAGALRKLAQLRVAQRRRLPGRAADDDAVAAVLQVEVEQARPGFEVDRAIGPHGSDDGNQA